MRQREFDPTVALGNAMQVFWERGYVDTSIEHLVARTGVSRYGLYGEFKNKHTLFLASLKHYLGEVFAELFQPVEAPDAAWPEIEAYFGLLLQGVRDDRNTLGCLMSVAGSEVARFDPKAAALVLAMQERMRRGFRRALAKAKERGQIRREVKLAAAADVLACTAYSLGFLMRTPMDRGAMGHFVERALDSVR